MSETPFTMTREWTDKYGREIENEAGNAPGWNARYLNAIKSRGFKLVPAQWPQVGLTAAIPFPGDPDPWPESQIVPIDWEPTP
jgi:hypothetical protein